MMKPSGILTMTRFDGKTHLELEQEYYINKQNELINFLMNEEVKKILKEAGEKLLQEYKNQRN